MNAPADLLKELRIDRKAAPPPPTSWRGLWIALGIATVLLLIAAAAWAHLDVYAWNDSDRPGKPGGGEAQGLRAAFAMLKARYG